jgi:sugar phosphate isomerase/epimerase
MYHNHHNEFRKIGGKLVLETLMEAVPPEEMGFTLDTFWVQAGGGDPAQWLERLDGRIPCIHLKDYAFGQSMAVIGEGNINFDRVFEKAEAGGTRYMLVEQDDCHGEDPIECLRRSYRYLKACGFD